VYHPRPLEDLVGQLADFVRLATPTQATRLQPLLGDGTRLDPTHSAAIGVLLRPLNPAHIEALVRMDRAVGAPDARTASMLDRSLADPLLLAGSSSVGWVINPVRICQYLELVESPTPSAWALHEADGDLGIAARIWLDLRARTDPRWVTWNADKSSWMAACGAFYRALPPHDPTIMQVAAARLRMSMLDALDAPANASPPLIQRLFDVPDPDEAPAWHSAAVLLLMQTDSELLASALAPMEPPEVDAAVLTWFASILLGHHTVSDWSIVPSLAGSTPDAADLLPLRPDQGISMDQVPRNLQSKGWTGRAPDSSLAELLVGGLLPCIENVPWTRALQLASHPELTNALLALLSSDEDWGDFDAVGEGYLPGIWARIALLADALTPELREQFLVADPELGEWLTESAVVDGGWFASPRRAGEHLSQNDQNPMSSYAHGLHDAVGEAYGDVYSRADPFSVRTPGGSAED
jgi:hypothetical protein